MVFGSRFPVVGEMTSDTGALRGRNTEITANLGG
jgi:hypothetical protein